MFKQAFENLPVSLLTHGGGFIETGKSWLLRKGFGSSRGPLALESNLVKGLNNLGVKFNIDPAGADFFSCICVLRSIHSIERIKNLSFEYKLVVGPNLKAMDLAHLSNSEVPVSFFLAPSKEVGFVYEYYGVPKEKIVIWPVGIDTEKFKDMSMDVKKTDALVYFKRRRKEELLETTALLKRLDQTFTILEYGSYNEAQLLQSASMCKYAVILDGTESQGIAIQSIMACNLPMFVFDQIYLGETKDLGVRENLRVTSVPYWSSVCGIKADTDSFKQANLPYESISETNVQFSQFLSNLSSFKPREYILQNLSLDKQAREFLNIFAL